MFVLPLVPTCTYIAVQKAGIICLVFMPRGVNAPHLVILRRGCYLKQKQEMEQNYKGFLMSNIITGLTILLSIHLSIILLAGLFIIYSHDK